MSSNLALSVHNLCKEYRIAHQGERPTTLSEALVSKIKKPLARTNYETFRALDDVSFEVEKGEVLGIIGRNGAGKSTLLKILSRITEPTYGEVRLFGRIGSLLEVGTGFHPELSGRENIFLNGAILGMRHKEIERQFDAIVDFAEVERFLDTPVKRYSSGMYVRLAFAVAAHLNPEILVVDEVLAVGDAQFQKKCLGKMQEVSQQDGRTVLFVSHNIGAIKALCTSCLLLDAGRVVFRGGTLEAAGLYSKMGLALTESGVRVDNGVTLREIKISETSNSRAMDSLHAYTDYLLSLHLEFSKPKEKIGVTITIRNEEDLAVSSICGPEEGIGWLAAKKSVHIEYSLPQLPLVPGKYSVDVDLFGLGGQVQFERALEFEVQETIAEGATASYNAQHGFFRIAQGGKVTIDSEAAEASIA